MASPFEYEDLMSEKIRSLEAHNNKYDPTGKLNELRLPPKYKQQAAARPKFYNPEQHSTSPHLSATISGPPTFSLKPPASYSIQITLTHHANPAGNPDKKPVTFRLKDTALTEIDDTDIYPWLLLLHDDDSSAMREVDDGNHGPAKPYDIDDGEEEEEPPISVDAQHGFASLAVGESIVFTTEFRFTGEGVRLEQAWRYSLCFRGSWVRWWRWGTLEQLRDEQVSKTPQDDGKSMIIIAATNRVDFTVDG